MFILQAFFYTKNNYICRIIIYVLHNPEIILKINLWEE